MRLFVAIDLGEKVVQDLVSAQRKLAGDYDISLVRPENMHLTLKFLGDVSEPMTGRIEKAISESLAPAFRISLQGIGFFGSPPKVIWAGVRDGREEFISLAGRLEKGLSFVRREEREPNPHLTIARVSSGRNSHDLVRNIQSMKDMRFGIVEVREIKLKKSVLTPKGPVYSDVKVFPLKESGG